MAAGVALMASTLATFRRSPARLTAGLALRLGNRVPQMADDNKTAWASYDRVRAALVKATARLVLDRDCLYEGITTSEGDIPDENDRQDLADADELIDECQAALNGLSRAAIISEADESSGGKTP